MATITKPLALDETMQGIKAVLEGISAEGIDNSVNRRWEEHGKAETQAYIDSKFVVVDAVPSDPVEGLVYMVRL